VGFTARARSIRLPLPSSPPRSAEGSQRMSTRRLAVAALWCAALSSLPLVACSSDPQSTVGDPPAEIASSEATPTPLVAPSRPLRADGFLPGVVRWRGDDPAYNAPRDTARIDASPTCFNPQLQYFGGPLLQDPIVVPVFWSSSIDATVKTNISQFYADV